MLTSPCFRASSAACWSFGQEYKPPRPGLQVGRSIVLVPRPRPRPRLRLPGQAERRIGNEDEDEDDHDADEEDDGAEDDGAEDWRTDDEDEKKEGHGDYRDSPLARNGGRSSVALMALRS